MMKRLTFCLIILTVFSLRIFAQKEAQVKDIMDQSAKMYADAGGVVANFTLNVKDVKAKTTYSFDGKIEMKSNKYHFLTPEAESWFDGKTQWIYQKDSEEVNISEPGKEEAQMMNPSVIFELYKNGCKSKYLGEKSDIKGRKVFEVELIPNSKKSQIKKVILQVNQKDYMPVMFTLFYSKDLQNIIYINTYKTQQQLPDSSFVFSPKNYPDVELIDLR